MEPAMTCHTARWFLNREEVADFLAKKKREKQIARLRLKMRGLNVDGSKREVKILPPLKPGGKPRIVKPEPPFIVYEGVRHYLDCQCHDCLWGEVAELKRIAAQGHGSHEVIDHAPARTGRVIKERM